MKAKHFVTKAGASVRLHGYAPAKVMAVFPRAGEPGLWAECRITGRNWRGQIGPHGYRTGQVVYVRAHEAVPRDLIKVQRGSGKLYWPAFEIETTGNYVED